MLEVKAFINPNTTNPQEALPHSDTLKPEFTSLLLTGTNSASMLLILTN